MSLNRFHEVETLVEAAWNLSAAGAAQPEVTEIAGGWPALVWPDGSMYYLDAFGQLQAAGNPPALTRGKR